MNNEGNGVSSSIIFLGGGLGERLRLPFRARDCDRVCGPASGVKDDSSSTTCGLELGSDCSAKYY